MQLKDKKILLCDCEASMPLDAKALGKACGIDSPEIATQLCRRQLNVFENALKEETPLIVACTQEAPMFLNTYEELESSSDVSFVNIREMAGWSKEKGREITPKITALLAESLLDIPPTKTVSMKSEGEVIIFGNSQTAIDAAEKLSTRLSVTVFLEPGSTNISPVSVDSYPIFSGRIRAARGHLGNFEIDVYDAVAATPSSKKEISFSGIARNETTICDLILDLRGKSLFTGAHKRDGYFNPAPTDTVAIAMALFDLSDMIGTFEKPQFIDYDPAICAHSRNQITGCNKCIDNCSTGAITSDGDHVKFDPYICAGCGDCASVCPTGAASYQMSDMDSLMTRQRTLLKTYLEAGGKQPVFLFHDSEYGSEMINTMARHYDGLPANVIPFAINSISQTGIELALSALAYGATQIQILVGQKPHEELAACHAMIELTNYITAEMGYGDQRVALLDNPDPEAINATLYNLPKLSQPTPASFASQGDKRSLIYMALEHLNAVAPQSKSIIDLPAGAPFGTLDIDIDNCTLCLACVGSCPANALQDGGDKPQLKFKESACVQCGLCAKTCPENIIKIHPRLELTGAARNLSVLKEEDPFECVRCGNEFGTKSTIERMIEKLQGHAMFENKEALDRLKMCDNCRVIALSESTEDPFFAGFRPVPRTTDDDIRERDEKLAEEKLKLDS